MTRPGSVQRSSESDLAGVRDPARSDLDSGLPAPAHEPATVGEADVLKDHSEYLSKLVDLQGTRPLKIVVDAGNGTALGTPPGDCGQNRTRSGPGTICSEIARVQGNQL